MHIWTLAQFYSPPPAYLTRWVLVGGNKCIFFFPGTIAFLRSISLEAVGLGVHLAAGAHEILLQAEYILSNIPSSVPWPVENRLKANIRTNQPKDAQQGIQQVGDPTCLFFTLLSFL